MIKPQSLRAAIEAAAPVLAGDGAALKMWIDRGAIRARSGPALAFEYRYTLNVVVEGWQQHPSIIVLAINRWLADQQPDLLSGGRGQAPSYTFEADIIDADTIDLAFEISLSEAVRVEPRGGDAFELVHAPEEDPLPDMAALAGLKPTPLLHQIWWKGERLVPEPPL